MKNTDAARADWTPGTATLLTVPWEQEETCVATRNTVQAIITLDISSGIKGKTEYSFKLVIEGDWIAGLISASPFF